MTAEELRVGRHCELHSEAVEKKTSLCGTIIKNVFGEADLWGGVK